jgi:hypothetical protein
MRKAMTIADYEAAICGRWNKAKKIPRKLVSLEGWQPEVNKCHENVDIWVRENANLGYFAVRGWINTPHLSQGVRLTAHSVVKAPNGRLFDITPFTDERLRATTRFVPHIGSDDSFFAIKEKSIFIDCPKNRSPIGELRPLRDLRNAGIDDA